MIIVITADARSRSVRSGLLISRKILDAARWWGGGQGGRPPDRTAGYCKSTGAITLINIIARRALGSSDYLTPRWL